MTRWLFVSAASLLLATACRDRVDQLALGPDLTDARTDSSTRVASRNAAGDTWAFAGTPTSPLPFNKVGWDVQVHSRDVSTWDAPEPLVAHHGMDCGPHPATHAITSWDQVVFRCRDHLMTTLRTDGYGAIVLTPDRMLDLSSGAGVVQFDLSTLRTSTRDWVAIWLVPWADDLPVPAGQFAPDLNGPPRNAIEIAMTVNGNFCATVYREFAATELPCNDWESIATKLTPSATQRTTFEIGVRDGRLRVGMPALNVWFTDAAIPGGVSFSQVLVRLAHYSYNPGKCDACSPGMTWHWDNVHIAPAVPFTIARGDRRVIRATTPTVVNFATPAPRGAVLRFTTMGLSAEVSFDNGISWQPAPMATVSRTSDPIAPVIMTVPVGVTRVTLRAGKPLTWWPNSDTWIAQDFAIFAPLAPTPRPNPRARRS